MALSGFVEGIGILGPGISDWSAAARILAGELSWQSTPTVLPAPQGLPSAERRRVGAIVKLALAVGLEATARAAVDPATLPAVFTSSGGDGQNCHDICQGLASADRRLSPTRFHNSVHNAAAGYWGIATAATSACNALCAYDGSFAAGLLEALTQASAEQTTVLLVAYDASYPEPLRSQRPIPDAFGVALVLAPEATANSLARLEASLSDAPAERLDDAALEGLRAAIPAARSLPLLTCLAQQRSGRAVLEYLEGVRLAVEVGTCR
jgi:hypothetical protein